MDLNAIYEFYIGLFYLICLFVFFCFFFIRNRKDYQFLLYLILASFLAVSCQFFFFLYIILPQYSFLYAIALFLLDIVFYFFYMYYETSSHTKISFWRHSLILCFFILSETLIITTYLNLYININLITEFALLIGGIFVTLCISFSLNVIMRIYKLTKKRAVLIELISVFILLMPGILFIIGPFLVLLSIVALNTLREIIRIVSIILVMISLFILLSNYLYHKDYIYHLPFPIYQIMLINKAGILVYNRRFNSVPFDRLNEEQEIILSGFIRALSSLITEVLGTKSYLKYVDTGGYQIYFTQIRENCGIVAILTSGGSPILQKSLERLANSISTDLLKEIQKYQVYSEEIQKKFDLLLTQAFPYLEFIENS